MCIDVFAVQYKPIICTDEISFKYEPSKTQRFLELTLDISVLMYVPCLLYSLLSRQTNAKHTYILVK